jgi:hypothetical protein
MFILGRIKKYFTTFDFGGFDQVPMELAGSFGCIFAF